VCSSDLRALILNGPSGTGKTSIAIALSKDNNLELFELNASDLRNRQSLEEVLKPAIEQTSLFKKGKLILMDEADGITGTDRGGLPELISLISKTSFPIIITANNIWDRKFNLLRQKCQIVNLKELDLDIISDIVEEILKKEKTTIDPDVLNLVIKKSKGDMRAVLNDLQTLLSLEEEIPEGEIYEREKQETIFNLLKIVFQSQTNKDILNIYENSDLDFDEISLWIEENIPVEYKGHALCNAYEALSKADIFKGRIYRQQHWRFLVYQNFFLSAGISAATKLKSNKFNQYKRPSRILKIWLSNQKQAKKKSIVSKFASFTHMSKKKAMKENFFLPLIIDKDAQKKLDLDESEIEWLRDRKGAIIVSQNLNRFRE
jgi:replication factor C large subunit